MNSTSGNPSVTGTSSATLTLDPWPSEPEACPEDLKLQINNFLWTRLPPNMTLGQAEDIACQLDASIRAAWSGYRPKGTP